MKKIKPKQKYQKDIFKLTPPETQKLKKEISNLLKRKFKTTNEKLWDYLVKKLGPTKTAKQIYHRMVNYFMG